MSPTGGAVVCNPGPMRWMRPMATGLAAEGLMRLYVTTLAPSARADRLLARLPAHVRDRARRELALRPLPEGVDKDMVTQAAPLSELLRVAAVRSIASTAFVNRASLAAGAAFDRSASRLIDRSDRVLLASYANALHGLRRSRELGVPGWLDYPTAHHDFAERLLRDEPRRQPDFASTLQLHEHGRARARLDREIALADRVIVLSSFARRSFLESGVDEAKLLQIPLGVELDLFRPREGERRRGPFRVLFAGQVTQRKGISYLLEGFRRASIEGAELTILGRPVGARGLPAPRAGVRYVPAVPLYELPCRYLDGDVFVLPSLVEGFPQTALQAMACGLPVIVSENTFGGDVITDGRDGYVVPIRDPEAIAERLRHLHSHPEAAARMGAAARIRAEDFSWEHYGRRIAAAVRELT